jgi:hypothetical protein
MRANQRKAGTCMIKTSIPLIHAMTNLTLFCISRRFVINRFRVVEIANMAGRAIRAESSEQANGGTLMAALAFYSRMDAEKRKPVRVAIDILRNLTPSANAMALFTIAAKLTAMNVRVATGALSPDVYKNQLHMTPAAIQAGMHSLQGKSGCAMVKIRERADGFKACRGMAIPARYFDGTMGIAHTVLRS